MKAKYLLLIVTLLLVTLGAQAQELTVKSMTLAAGDLTASTERRMDINGKPCALVKVQLPSPGAVFEGNVIQPVDYKTNEYWVYMTEGSKELHIKHPNFQTLVVSFPNYGIKNLKSLSTYRLLVTVPYSMYTSRTSDDGMRYLVMTVEPANAMVYIDNQPQMVRNGTVSIRLSKGMHTYRVEAAGYASKSGDVELAEERRSLSVSLESAFARVSVSCPTKGAEIYVNEQKQGFSPWSGQLSQGNYVFEARLEGYQSQRQSVTLQEREQRTIELPSLTPYMGAIDINYQPVNSEVWIDGKYVGVSPDIFRHVTTGSHTVEIKCSGYQTAKHTVIVKSDETIELGGELSMHLLTEVQKKQMKDEFDKAYNLYNDKQYNESFPIFYKLAKAGFQNGTLFGYLGMSYQFGNGTEKDEQQMLYWYEKAYQINEGWACYYYGNVLYKKELYEKALKCFVKASTSNWAEQAAFNAAKMYEEGKGTEVNKEKAVEYYRISAKHNRISPEFSDAVRALKRLGFSVFTEEDIASTTKWTEKSAYMAGCAYENGDGVEKNLDRAIEMYRESAKHVFGPLEYSDAGRALKRLGVAVLPASAYENVQISTMGMTAQQMFEKGKDNEKRSYKPDYPKAFAFYQAAAEAGSEDALLRLGEIYLGTPSYPFKDIPKAISYFEQLENRKSKACENLGWVYKTLAGYKDKDKALYYYKKGSDFHNNDGCPLWAGFLYQEKGEYADALRYFILSAETPPKNQGWAMYMVGTYYENGKGCVKNLSKAIEWYQKSAKTNNAYAKDAKEALQRLGITQ